MGDEGPRTSRKSLAGPAGCADGGTEVTLAIRLAGSSPPPPCGQCNYGAEPPTLGFLQPRCRRIFTCSGIWSGAASEAPLARPAGSAG
jgi:hypothetical protein